MRNRKASLDARKEILAVGDLTTLKELLASAEQFHINKTGFREFVGSALVDYSYAQLIRDVRALGTALMAEGAENCHIAILGENSYRWVVSYLAVTMLGVAVPLDKELTPEDLKNLVEKSNTSILFASQKYINTALKIQSENPAIRSVVLMTSDENTDNVETVDTLLEKGNRLLAEGDCSFTDRPVSPDDVASIQFTSGTTGANKGVQLTHRNICANVNAIAKAIPIENISFSVLPMNHTLECNCHILPGIYLGATICFNSSLKRMMRNLNVFKPEISVVVPQFIDEIYSAIWINAKRQNKEKQLKMALFVSRTLGFFGVDVRDKLFRTVHESFGGNLKLLICGGAPLNLRSAKGLYDLGIDIINGYGITECAPLVTVNLRGRKSLGSSGRAVPGVSIRIEKSGVTGVGEILVKGNNVTSGYYRDEESDQASLQDGWFRTGDYGYLDYKKQLWIVGRKKNLIILDNGKNVFPEEIETLIVSSLDYVKEVVVYEAVFTIHGHKRHQIVAAIAYKPDADIALLSEKERKERISADIRKLNRQLAAYKRISAIRITNKEFKKNAAHKIIRAAIAIKGNYVFI